MTIRAGPAAGPATWHELDHGATGPRSGASPAEPEAPSGHGHEVGRKRLNRSPHTRRRLGRLRHELKAIATLPCSVEDAREQILCALARADLGDWTLPSIQDDSTQQAPDGSVLLRLLAHAVVINPWGAFRIVDQRAHGGPYFESRGCGGRAFEPPSGLPSD
jgi:hypothetical protein